MPLARPVEIVCRVEAERTSAHYKNGQLGLVMVNPPMVGQVLRSGQRTSIHLNMQLAARAQDNPQIGKVVT